MDSNIEIKKEDLFLYEDLRDKQSQYPQYVINLQNQLFSKNDVGSVLVNLQDMIILLIASSLFSVGSVLVNLQDMIECDKDKTVALLENLLSLVQNAKKDSNIRIDVGKLKSKSWSNYQSGFSAYIEIIKKHIENNRKYHPKRKKWKKYAAVADNIEYLVNKIDGTESLLQAFDHNVSRFIKVVLENSYFFDPAIVKQRHIDIMEKYNNNEKLPARWTETYKSSTDTKEEIKKLSKETDKILYYDHPVLIDKDGNSAVRELIEDKFGYTVSQGQKSIFQYYKISHIWGEAYNPLKFTNLWNIVLVPAWANDLLDKNYSRDKLIVTFKQVIKAICLKFYEMDELDWQFMNMPNYQDLDEQDYLTKLHNKEFKIKWIESKIESKKDFEEKGDKSSLGKIRSKTIKIN